MASELAKVSLGLIKILSKNDTGINRYSSIFAVKSFHILLSIEHGFLLN
jgi:hypothetical protein